MLVSPEKKIATNSIAVGHRNERDQRDKHRAYGVVQCQRSLRAYTVDQIAEIKHGDDASKSVEARREDRLGRRHAGQVQYFGQPEDEQV